MEGLRNKAATLLRDYVTDRRRTAVRRSVRYEARLPFDVSIHNAGKISKPLFVVQGKNDPRVPYTEAEQIVAAARKNNTPVWYLMANDEGLSLIHI